MALNIGGVTFAMLRPPNDKPIPPLLDAFEDETRIGSDGHGDRDIGTRAEAVLWSALNMHANVSAALTHIAALEAKRTSTLISTEDQDGTAVANAVRVESVTVAVNKAVISGSDTRMTVVDVLLRRVQ